MKSRNSAVFGGRVSARARARHDNAIRDAHRCHPVTRVSRASTPAGMAWANGIAAGACDSGRQDHK